MNVLTRRLTPADKLALWAWIAVALTPVGWALGFFLALLSGEGQARGAGPVTLGLLGILLFVAAAAASVVLAVRAARAGHQSGRIAEAVSGVLFAATLVLTLLLGVLGLIVIAVAAVLVFVGARSDSKPSPPGSHDGRREGTSPASSTSHARS